MGVYVSHWGNCADTVAGYVAPMSEKKTQRNVRIPDELVKDIQRMADSLHEVGLLPDANWSGALVMILMQAKKAGLLEIPPTWYQPPQPSQRRAKK